MLNILHSPAQFLINALLSFLKFLADTLPSPFQSLADAPAHMFQSSLNTLLLAFKFPRPFLNHPFNFINPAQFRIKLFSFIRNLILKFIFLFPKMHFNSTQSTLLVVLKFLAPLSDSLKKFFFPAGMLFSCFLNLADFFLRQSKNLLLHIVAQLLLLLPVMLMLSS